MGVAQCGEKAEEERAGGYQPRGEASQKIRSQRGPKPTPYTLDKQSTSEGITPEWRVGGELMDDSTSLDQRRLGEIGDGHDFIEDLGGISLTFDISRMFEPLSSREPAARAFREYMQEREYSDDPDIRQYAHFEGHLNPQMFHKMNSRSIPASDVKLMKKMGYKILEFGRFYWEDFASALEIYHTHYGHINVPLEYVLDRHVMRNGSDEDRGGPCTQNIWREWLLERWCKGCGKATSTAWKRPRGENSWIISALTGETRLGTCVSASLR